MLQLPNITLISVSTRNVEEAANALARSCRGVEYGAVKLLSPYRPPNLIENFVHEEVKEFDSIDDWNRYIFYELHNHVTTDFCILVHPDGWVINPDKWQERFLDYDYIGAPWPITMGDSFKDIDGNIIRVGNSVSIRSKRLLQLPTQLNLPWEPHHEMYNEDTQICVHYRHHFTGAGMSFAPVEVAKHFSLEVLTPEVIDVQPFAFHSYGTCDYTFVSDDTTDAQLQAFAYQFPDSVFYSNGYSQPLIDRIIALGYKGYSYTFSKEIRPVISLTWYKIENLRGGLQELVYFFFKKNITAMDNKAITLDDIYSAYINLDSRPDRDVHMQKELERVELSAERRRALLPDEVHQPKEKTEVMQNRTPGAIGCHYSQVALMEEALRQNKHAWVMEDDLVYCSDLQDRLVKIFNFLSTNEWDIFWLGGTYHTVPTWHRSVDGLHTHPDLQMCSCDLNRDWEPAEGNIVRTYGCWSTYSYIVNRNRLSLILERLDMNIYRSMGIDWSMILLQPQLNTFAFNPGCCKQFDNQSNIGDGITKFSVFETLGSHWFADRL